MKRFWNLAPAFQIAQKTLKHIALAYIYQLAKLGDLMSCGSKNVQKWNLSHVLILIMTSQIIEIMGRLKMQKLEYL